MSNRKNIIVWLIIALNLSCVTFAKPVKVDYLIPENFTGGVIIVFNQPDGITPETSADGTVIYRIPIDGLIKVKEPLNRNVYELKYYFVDEKGNRTPIEYLYPKHSVRSQGVKTPRNIDEVTEDESNSKVFASFHETSNFNVSGEKVYVQSFIVEKPINTLNTFTQTEDRVFNIQRELLNGKKSIAAGQTN